MNSQLAKGCFRGNEPSGTGNSSGLIITEKFYKFYYFDTKEYQSYGCNFCTTFAPVFAPVFAPSLDNYFFEIAKLENFLIFAISISSSPRMKRRDIIDIVWKNRRV